MAIQRTLSIIKPDATRRNLTGAINQMLEKAGLRIIAQKRIKLSKKKAEGFYSMIFDADITVFSKNKKFFNYSSLLDTILEISELEAYTLMVSEKVAVQNESNSSFVKMVGVDDNYTSVYEIEELIETGNWLSNSSTVKESVVSFDLADQLNLGLYNYGGGINILIPNLKKNSFFSRAHGKKSIR